MRYGQVLSAVAVLAYLSVRRRPITLRELARKAANIT